MATPPTRDVDITPSTTPENLTRLADALTDLDARCRVVDGPPEGVEIPGGFSGVARTLGVDLVERLVYYCYMNSVGVHEAKTNLSKLLRRVAAGEEIIIMRSGQPIAKLIPLAPVSKRRLGVDEGVLEVPDDFDASLPEDVLTAFEG